MNKTTAIVLAGGKSERFGADKSLLEIRGASTVLRHLGSLQSLVGGPMILITNNVNHNSHIDLLKKFATLQIRVQFGTNMESAIETGLSQYSEDDRIMIVCSNDIVSSIDYKLYVAASETSTADITIAVAISNRLASGGLIEIKPRTLKIDKIIEKPVGGIPAGSLINVMIHTWKTPQLIVQLKQLLQSGISYEDCINSLIKAGAQVQAVPIMVWRPIKTKDDLTALLADPRL